MYYILDENNEPVKTDRKGCAAWTEVQRAKRWGGSQLSVKCTNIVDETLTLSENIANRVLGESTVQVSTVFLRIDHGFSTNNPPDYKPILWETMVFGGKYDQSQWRYTSHAAAVAGHARVVRALQAGLNPKE